MRKFGLIGYPISHSESPKLFEEAYHGRWQYDLIESPDFEYAWNLFLREYEAVNITAPFKADAFRKADIISPECNATGAANIAVRTSQGIKVHNSDYLGLRMILAQCGIDGGKVTVVGGGGAGRAAFAAANDSGYSTELLHHDEIAGGIDSDIIIYTLPKAVEGIDKFNCRLLFEANYRDPCLRDSGLPYVSGREWLKAQAVTGYEIMTGEKTDFHDLCLYCKQ
ncbi:MAG: hypothetical protein MJY42_04140 [Bacteroidales bacterium]|nr:hypothetical protein [Bacteroidales bacterium]